jgi:hypothetical protein
LARMAGRAISTGPQRRSITPVRPTGLEEVLRRPHPEVLLRQCKPPNPTPCLTIRLKPRLWWQNQCFTSYRGFRRGNRRRPPQSQRFYGPNCMSFQSVGLVGGAFGVASASTRTLVGRCHPKSVILAPYGLLRAIFAAFWGFRCSKAARAEANDDAATDISSECGPVPPHHLRQTDPCYGGIGVSCPIERGGAATPILRPCPTH